MTDLFHREVLNRFVKLMDVGAAVAAFTTAGLLIYPLGSVGRIFSLRVSVSNAILFACLLVLWHLCFTLARLYRPQRTRETSRELVHVLRGVTLATGVLVLWRVLFDIQLLSPRFFVLFWALGVLLLGTFRTSLRLFLQYLRRRGRNIRHLVIVGTNARAKRTARLLLEDRSLGYKLTGFVDDPWPGSAEVSQYGRVVASLDQFAEFLRHNPVDEVIICLPMRSYYQASAGMVDLCERLGVTAGFPPDQFGTGERPERKKSAQVSSVMAIYGGIPHGAAYLFKRLFDFLVGLTLIVVLSPLMLVIALVIKFSSAGDVLFVQQRIGLNRRRFSMLKFRTMRQDAEKQQDELQSANEASGPVFKMSEDPRVTPVGRLLRRTSLDELPQLFNVVLGEMSLVGPRPLPVRDYSGFTEDWHRRRFSVRPGMTCLWQVRGRSSLSFKDWMELDLFYIDNWSLWLDLKILFLTIPVVLRRSGAY